jgi:hypothetical protein
MFTVDPCVSTVPAAGLVFHTVPGEKPAEPGPEAVIGFTLNPSFSSCCVAWA